MNKVKTRLKAQARGWKETTEHQEQQLSKNLKQMAEDQAQPKIVKVVIITC